MLKEVGQQIFANKLGTKLEILDHSCTFSVQMAYLLFFHIIQSETIMPGGGHIGSWIRLMKENTYDDHA
jgi:hypothetical protein